MPDSVPLTQPTTATAAPVVSRLGEIRQRADRATKGPWEVATHPSDGDYDYISGYITSEHHTYCGCGVEGCGHRNRVTDWHSLTAPDAHFIAAARDDVPWLLDALDVALADRDRARDLAAALEAENTQLQRQRNRLFNACERYAVPESAIRHACEPVGGYPTTEATT